MTIPRQGHRERIRSRVTCGTRYAIVGTSGRRPVHAAPEAHQERSMIDEQEQQRWREALAEAPAGADHSALTGYPEHELPWSWRTLVESLAPKADRVLDLGTGGGGVLATLADVLPEGTVATEGRAENLPLARERLTPLGIEVLEHRSEGAGARLPVAEGSFDLVLSRHQPYDPADVARVLTSGGTFLTEQVGEDDAQELREALGIQAPSPERTLENAVHELTAAGLTIVRSAAFHDDHEFDDMVDLLRYLRWNRSEDLSEQLDRDALERLHAQLQDGPFTATVSRYLVLARTPEAPDTGRTDFAALLGDDLEVPRV